MILIYIPTDLCITSKTMNQILTAQKAFYSFSQNDEKLLAISTTFGKYKFKSLKENLSQKYQLVEKKLEFVGDQYVKYQNDETIIELKSPHMSFELNLLYIDKEFNEQVEQAVKQEKNQKKQKELDSL